MARDTNSSLPRRSNIGVALIVIGALFLMVAYVAGWTSSNVVLLIGLIIIFLGAIQHVRQQKKGEKY